MDKKWLVAILILGVLLRAIIASNVTPVADEMVHATHAMGIAALKPLSTMTQGPLWFYLTDFAYLLFDVTLFSSRFLAFFFGSLSIVLTYMIGKIIFNEKSGLVAAFLLAISTFHIGWMTAYMDEAMMFFILFAIYYFIKEYKERGEVSLIAAIFLGIAIQIKIITFVFSVIFCLFIVFLLWENYKKDRKKFKHNLKRALNFAVILIASCIPLFAYNLFLYQEKGIVDLPFSLYFNIHREYYQGPGLSHENGFVLANFPTTLYQIITSFFMGPDPLLFFLGLFGLPFVYREYKKNKFTIGFMAVISVFAFLFIAASVVLPNHFTSFCPFLALSGSLFLIWGTDALKKKYSYVPFLKIILILCLLFSLYYLSNGLTTKSATDKMRSFTIESIGENDLVVVDSRIYRGTIAWMFNDKHYIESATFPKVFNLQQNSQKKIPITVWFIECAPDDCGWGTIKDQPDFNKSTEDLFDVFRNASTLKEVFQGGGDLSPIKGGERPGAYYKIYQGIIPLDPRIVSAVDQTHSMFFYEVRRNKHPQQAFDYYTIEGPAYKLLNFIAYTILYFYILLALLSPLYLAYVWKNE